MPKENTLGGIMDCKGWSNWKRLGKTSLEYRTYCTWKGMLTRCYSSRYQETHPTYKGCTVCKEWMTLSNFAKDIKELPNYELWRDNPNKLIQLDKDARILGNIEYNKYACSFMTIQENNREFIGRRGVPEKFKQACWRHSKAMSKKIKCVYPDGREHIFESSYEAKKLGFNRGQIWYCLKGIKSTYRDCKWYYCD